MLTLLWATDCRKHVDLAGSLGQTTQPRLLKTELLLDYSKGVITIGADVGLGGFDQISLPAIRGI